MTISFLFHFISILYFKNCPKYPKKLIRRPPCLFGTREYEICLVSAVFSGFPFLSPVLATLESYLSDPVKKEIQRGLSKNLDGERGAACSFYSAVTPGDALENSAGSGDHPQINLLATQG